jgi:type II secretory pathway predicted ATPase ExeA
MDQIRLQHDLEQVDEQLAAVQRQIGRQHKLIWDLDQAKQNTAEAWSLLTELETAQALHATHRDQITQALKRL